MIPFWKKTGKHSKPQSAQKRRQNAKPAMPRTAQQSIPMQRMFEDGTCRVKPNYYTRTIQYQDINYQLAQQEDKTAIFEEWCSFLNFFDSSIKFELSFVNMATDSTEFEKSIRIPFQKDGFDDVRAEYSQMLRQQLAKGNNGLTKTKFITFGVEGESMAQVKPRLDHIQNDLLNNFHRLGVQAKPLNSVQRLKLMHDMFNMDGASKFHFDWKDLVKSGLSVKDTIAPTAFAFKNSRTFQMGGIYCAASFLSITASDISDQLLKDFLDMQAKKKARTTKSSTRQPDKAQNAEGFSVFYGETSEGSSNWLSWWRQKQDIRKGYYAAARSGGTAAQTAGGKKAASSGASAARSGVEQIIDKGKSAGSTAINGLATAAKSNAHVLVIVGVFLLLILMVMSGFSSCGILFSGGTQVSGQTMYSAEDRDIRGAEQDYKKLEKELDKNTNSVSFNTLLSSCSSSSCSS